MMVRDRGGWRRGQEEGREREGGAEVELRTWRWGLRGGGSEGEVSAQRQRTRGLLLTGTTGQRRGSTASGHRLSHQQGVVLGTGQGNNKPMCRAPAGRSPREEGSPRGSRSCPWGPDPQPCSALQPGRGWVSNMSLLSHMTLCPPWSHDPMTPPTSHMTL